MTNRNFKAVKRNNLNINKGQSIINLVQKLFDDTFSLFVFNSDFVSAIWYNNLLNKFKILLEDETIARPDIISNSISIYKELIVEKSRIISQ